MRIDTKLSYTLKVGDLADVTCNISNFIHRCIGKTLTFA